MELDIQIKEEILSAVECYNRCLVGNAAASEASSDSTNVYKNKQQGLSCDTKCSDSMVLKRMVSNQSGIDDFPDKRKRKIRNKGNSCSQKEKTNYSKDSKTDSSVDTFKSHCLLTRNRLIYCSKCPFVATKKISFEIHQTVHDKSPPFQCEYCDHISRDAADFNDHIFTHSKEEPFTFTCLLCDNSPNSFSTCSSADFQYHIDSHHPDTIKEYGQYRVQEPPHSVYQTLRFSTTRQKGAIFKCEKCDFIATKKISVDHHQTMHTTKNPYRCPKCEYKTTRRRDFSSHILNHFDDKPYDCPHCPRMYVSSRNLHRHVKLLHSDVSLSCPECDYSAPFRSLLYKHKHQRHSTTSPISTANLIKLKSIKCKHCSFVATKEESVELHQIVHTTKSPFSCTSCTYQTCNRYSFSAHILVHFDDKPYKCPFCIQSYTNSSSVNKHINSLHSVLKGSEL